MSTPVTALTAESAARRAGFLDLPATLEAHDEAMAGIAAFGEVETGGQAQAPVPPGPLRIAAWNVERCLFPGETADLLRTQGAGLVLLSEVDNGCHRTGQRHTTRLLAEHLGHGYGFGLEFLELVAMKAPIAIDGNEEGNRLGFHGNGFTSALPFDRPVVIHLPPEADWYISPKGGQRRIGRRNAVAATFHHGGKVFVACSVHLESASDFAGRDRQMRHLFDALEDYAQGLPIIIGGDLNTAVAAGGLDDARELLFQSGRERGYDWDACNAAGASCRPSTWSGGAGEKQLDWFCTRGMKVSDPRMIAPLAPDGRVLSDHSLITIAVEF
ncbi:endonuclease/exonuclease/phosphatase [Acetobacteraceae bacterium H6797]|nr:endonuclease/exonuclease/phosphatase [Acetobacteraceae bacterium H6797]